MNVDQFRQAIRSAGLEPPEDIEPGRLHRFSTNGKRHDDAGWCKLFPDGQGGVFGDFRSGLSETWQAQREKPFTSAEREAFRQRCEAERKAREAEQARAHAKAREKAAAILEGATGDATAHPYAIKKHVPFGPLVKRGAWPQRGWTDALLVPLYDGKGCLSAVEAINADGDKDFLKGGRMAGGFYPFGKVSGADRVLIGEGISTVAACVAADPSPAAAALCSGNLRAVAEAVRELAPGADIILLADFDVKPDGSNPGLNAAREAAREVRGRIATPELDGRACDMWDVWAEGGLEAVRRVIAGAKAPDTESTAEDLDATVRRLAELSPIAYDRVREDEAKHLGVRVSTLDAEVEKLRRKMAGDSDDAQGAAVLFPDVDPWSEQVNGALLLDDLAASFRRYAVLPKLADVAIALWVVFSHAIDSVNIAPILALTSPERRCGKSTVLALLVRLVLRSLSASNISPAAVFRVVDRWAPTLLIDEADSFLRNSDELRGIINSGHTRDSAYVVRTVGDDHEPRRFSTWSAKAIALIGKLPDTLSDRSIEVQLKRKLPGELVEKLRHADPEKFSDLARQCARWVSDHAEAIKAARPSVPDALNDRAQDSWEPLLAIADLAGGPWPKLAREAALALSGVTDAEDEGLRVQLLADVRDVFKEEGGDLLTTAVLIERLCSMEDHPWGVANRGKPITANWLARRLKPFGVKPKQLWTGRNDRGYPLDQFEDPFRRYLPDQTVRSARTQAGCGPQPSSQSARNPNPSTCEDATKPSSGAGSSGSNGYAAGVGEGEGDRETGTI